MKKRRPKNPWTLRLAVWLFKHAIQDDAFHYACDHALQTLFAIFFEKVAQRRVARGHDNLTIGGDYDATP